MLDIVKVQRSIATNESERQVFIYNRDRSIEYQTPESELGVIDHPDPYWLKCYMTASVDDKGILHLHKLAGDQSW